MGGNEPQLAELHLATLRDTDRLGEYLSALLPSGCCVVLSGTLGAGKTRLVQAILAGYGIDSAEVTSPTFALLNSYRVAVGTLHHMDAYRVEDEDAFLELGVEEFLGVDRNVTLIEWGERVAGVLPEQTLWFELQWHPDERRELCIRGDRELWGDWAERLRVAWEGAGKRTEDSGREVTGNDRDLSRDQRVSE